MYKGYSGDLHDTIPAIVDLKLCSKPSTLAVRSWPSHCTFLGLLTLLSQIRKYLSSWFLCSIPTLNITNILLVLAFICFIFTLWSQSTLGSLNIFWFFT